MLGTLFYETNVSIGARIEFVHNWSEWIKSFDNDGVQSLSVGDTESRRLEPLTASVVIDVASHSNDLDLFTILKSNQYGSSVMETYGKTKTICIILSMQSWT